MQWWRHRRTVNTKLPRRRVQSKADNTATQSYFSLSEEFMSFRKKVWVLITPRLKSANGEQIGPESCSFHDKQAMRVIAEDRRAVCLEMLEKSPAANINAFFLFTPNAYDNKYPIPFHLWETLWILRHNGAITGHLSVSSKSHALLVRFLPERLDFMLKCTANPLITSQQHLFSMALWGLCALAAACWQICKLLR